MNFLLKIIKTCFSVALLGVLGALFCQTGVGNYVEEEVGLDWLFKLRGQLPPPAEVVIVTIDRDSAEKLKLPDDPENWPRTFYAQLIEKINTQQPAVIAFNLHFSESKDQAADQLLAKAMQSDKNVILSNYIKQQTVPDLSPIGEVHYESVIEPISILNEAAWVTSPFPLPKTSSTVKEFWKYSNGGLATFPASIFQFFVLQESHAELMWLLGKIDPGFQSALPRKLDDFKKLENAVEVYDDIQAVLIKDELTAELVGDYIDFMPPSSKPRRYLGALLALLSNKERLFLNFYGDSGSITTVPFHQVLTDKQLMPDLFKDKIVLVGYHDNIEPEKYQGFYSIFSKESGKVISPIEIAATAVANMVDRSWLSPLPALQQVYFLLFSGVWLSGLFFLFSYRTAMSASVVSIAVLIAFDSYQFTEYNRWLPLVIPLLQAMVVILWQTTTYLFRLRQVSGTHLPQEVIDQIARNGRIDEYGLLMHGVCLATDIDEYTSLSEAIGSRQIAKLINDYNAAIYPRITGRKGLILNNIGDAILAGWVAKKIDGKLRQEACLAALEIKSAIDRFNKTSPYPLQTRIGLHYGEMEMSFVGAEGRFEYRAVGDTVNTATRIEGLNKFLGTRILVSSPVIEALPALVSRELGTFLLKGKTQPVCVHELMSTATEVQHHQKDLLTLLDAFNKALILAKSNNYEAALSSFREIQQQFPEDGPTLFYIRYLQRELALKSNAHPVAKQGLLINVASLSS